MNRFSEKKQFPKSGGIVISALGAAAILAVSWMGFQKMETDAKKKELENLSKALEQSAVICYALEGSYPESLEYLKNHYGISWDEQRFLVDFEAIGSNLPPDITVIPRS